MDTVQYGTVQCTVQCTQHGHALCSGFLYSGLLYAVLSVLYISYTILVTDSEAEPFVVVQLEIRATGHGRSWRNNTRSP